MRTKEGVAREGLAEGPRGASNTESQTGPAPAQGLGEGTADGDRELGSASEGTGVPTEDVRQDPDWHRRASKVSTHERFWTQNKKNPCGGRQEYVEALVKRDEKSGRVHSRVRELWKYFDGKHIFEEIMWRAHVSRDEIMAVVKEHKDVLFICLHE